MINEIETFAKFGYKSETLTNGTKKSVILNCDFCNSLFERKYCKVIQGRKISLEDSCLDKTCLNKKRELAMMKNFGVTSVGKLSIGKKETEQHKKERALKIKSAVQKKYGVDNVFQLDVVKEKIKKQNLENLGVEYPSQNPEIVKKQKMIMMERYGYDSPLQIPEFKEKAKQSTIDRYGVDYYAKTSEFKELCKNRRKKINGKTLHDISEETGKALSTVTQQVALYGFNYVFNINKRISGIELKFIDWLKSENIKYQWNKTIGPYRPDFKIDNLIVELNGNYWHSDKILENKKYHSDKKKFYADNNLKSIFFTEDEINNKFEIIKSIVLYKIGFSNKIFARKCEIIELDKKQGDLFFRTNHLMDCGAGKIIALKIDNSIVCAIRYYIKSKELHISRFCNVLNTTVTGGFSKLLNAVIKKENPSRIINFIDLRYGDGHHLLDLGFTLKNISLSFTWTNFQERFGRMSYPGNSGYDNGLYKIWDCGQAKYVKDIQD